VEVRAYGDGYAAARDRIVANVERLSVILRPALDLFVDR